MLWSLVVAAAILGVSSALNLPGVPSTFTASDEVLSAISDEIALKFANEYVTYLKSGTESATLRQLSQQLAASHSQKDIFTKSIEELETRDQFFVCTTCRATANVVARMFLDPEGELNGPDAAEKSKEAMLDICARLDIQTEEVCAGLFDINWPYIDFVLQNSVANTRTICGMLPISFCTVKQQEFNWSLQIDANGPAIDKPKAEKPNKSDKDLQILQVSDIHYDPEYVAGGVAVCNEPVCCNHTPPPNEPLAEEKQAGYWGDYRNCDAPLHLIENAFEQMTKDHDKIDYIYQTGDIVPHSSWKAKREGNIAVLTKINDLIVEKFPGIPVYPCVGSYESHPSHVFGPATVPEELSTKWLYEHLYTLWSKWLPADTKETILKGGYYTVSPKPGFRIISINNNDCNILNWWLYLDGSMGVEQLKWLHATLLAAEQAGEYVHILAHIPSGGADCWTVWAREYNRIIERFSAIISATFNGHTHKDELNVHYSAKGHAIGVSWNGGSLTPYSQKNPNYKMYQVEPTNMQVVDLATWITNLTAANTIGAESTPIWYKNYQFSAEFTDDMSPAGIDALLEKMAENPELLRKYWRYQMTSADPKLNEGCDNKCLSRSICRLATSVYNQKDRCQELQTILEKQLATETTTTEPSLTTKDPEGGGAVTMSAFAISTLIALICAVKLIF